MVIGPFMVVGGCIGFEKSHGLKASPVAYVAKIPAPAVRTRTDQFSTTAPMKSAEETICTKGPDSGNGSERIKRRTTVIAIHPCKMATAITAITRRSK